MKKKPLTFKKQLNNSFVVAIVVQCFLLNQTWAEQFDEIEELAPVVVTGSYIPNSNASSTTPVITLDREFIDRSGATTVNELFRKSIYNSAGIIDEQFTQGFAPASSGINLRGIGLSRTLVLLDGRRMPIFPFAQSPIGRNNQDSFVDVNLVPLSAVERIEILKDGASALYGADAVAGVVNIITHKDYDGAKISGQYGATLKVDGEEGRAEILAGKSWEKTNVTLAFDYLNRSEIRASDRHYSDSALGPIDDRSNAGNPGSIINLAADSPRPSPDPRCPASQQKGPFCSFDFASYNTLVPEVERTGFSGALEHEINEKLSFFARGIFSHTESERTLAPASINDLLIVAPDNPNNTVGDPLGVIYRFTELGARTDEFETDSYHFVGGLNGEIADWDWELGSGIGHVETQNTGVNGYATQTSLQDAVDRGELNPFGSSPSFNPASVMVTPTRKGESEVYFVDFKANGVLYDSDKASLKLAVGTEYRHEDFSDSFDDITAAGDVIGTGGTSGHGSRQIEAVYFEFYATVLDQLDMQFAGRMDHYSDFGTTFNPKFSLRWDALDNLTFRGNVGTGFKAPALHELYSGDINAFETVFDPVTQTTVNNVELISSGNPDLEAEESFNHGFGLAWNATDWWLLSIDYWNIRNDNAVATSPQFYLNNESRFPNNVIRDDSGEISSILSPFNNVSAQKMWGLDMHTAVDWEWLELGYFRLDVNGTYLGSFREESVPGAGFIDYAGKDGVPRWRAQGSLTWTKSDYEVSLTTNFVDGYDRIDSGDTIGSWTTIDVQGVWRPTMLEGTTLSIGTNNVFNESPPEDPNFEGWPFFNRALASPRGRFVYLRAQYEF